MTGKFVSDADAYTYELSLDGTGETVGDVQYRGYAALVEFVSTKPLVVPFPDGSAIGARRVGAIVEEDSQGFVAVLYYSDHASLARAFRKISRELELPEGWEG